MVNENSKKETNVPFEPSFFERVRCCPKTKEELDWWASELLRWSEREDSIVFYEFASIMGIPKSVLTKMSNDSENLKAAFSIAKERVGSRRERLALKNELNASIVMKTMAIYDEDFAKYERDMKLLSAEIDNKTQPINIIMQKMPETDAVPVKKAKKKKDS